MTAGSIDWQDVLQAAEALKSFPNAIFDALNKYSHSPSPTSKASNELANSVEADELRTAYAQGGQQLIFACDHTLAIHRLLVTQPQLSYSPWACVRGVLESCSICTLVLDPVIDSVERITRSLNLRIEGIWRAQTHVRKISKVTPALAQGIDRQVSQWDSRVAHLRQKALALGIAEKFNKNGRFLGFGQGVQSISHRIDDAFGASEDYSLLSAPAHAETWGILYLGSHVEVTKPLRAVPGLSPERAMYLIARPIEWVARGLWAYYQLFDWNLEEGKVMLEAEYDRAGLRHELRFWR